MSERPGLTPLGKVVSALFVAGLLAGAGYFLLRGWPSRLGTASAPGDVAPEGGDGSSRSGEGTRIGIAYGTEKQRWLEWAVEEFAKTRAGRRVEIDLLPMGSLEGAQAILRGDERIHVWSPASALYTETFVREWRDRHGREPVLRGEALALSPMVFVFWKERYEAFVARYGAVSFRTIGEGLAELSGWVAIARRPEWGLFKVGHTHPNQSNSGLATLVLMAYDFAGRSRGLALADVLDPGFQQWMQAFEAGVSGLAHSTGTQMRDMVLKGPSTFDALIVYENVAIDYLKNAEGRWGELQVAYPPRNFWNDNPYYILDVPWSTAAERRAAGEFLDYLLSAPVQERALTHGFRPGNPEVPVRTPASPFTTYARFGLRVDLTEVCETPPAEVIQNLLASWQRGQGRR